MNFKKGDRVLVMVEVSGGLSYYTGQIIRVMRDEYEYDILLDCGTYSYLPIDSPRIIGKASSKKYTKGGMHKEEAERYLVKPDNNPTQSKETTKIRISFNSPNQTHALMIVKEIYNKNGDVTNSQILYQGDVQTSTVVIGDL